MTGVYFRAWREQQYAPLSELLWTMGRPILRLKWTLRILEVALEPGSSSLESVNSERVIDSLELLHLVTPAVQIIEGEMAAQDAHGQSVLAIRAVDGTWWDIETEESQILCAIVGAYPDAKKLPR